MTPIACTTCKQRPTPASSTTASASYASKPAAPPNAPPPPSRCASELHHPRSTALVLRLSRQVEPRTAVHPQGEPADQDESITSARPELWAVWLEEATTYIDTRTGEAVDEYDVDWDIAANDTDTEAEEGYIHPRYVQETSGFKQTFYCLDPAAAGLITSEDHYGQRGSARGGGIETAEQAEARKDAERRERRKVVVLNKLGQAAAEVRQAWVKDTLLSRKPRPKVPRCSSPASSASIRT